MSKFIAFFLKCISLAGALLLFRGIAKLYLQEFEQTDSQLMLIGAIFSTIGLLYEIRKIFTKNRRGR